MVILIHTRPSVFTGVIAHQPCFMHISTAMYKTRRRVAESMATWVNPEFEKIFFDGYLYKTNKNSNLQGVIFNEVNGDGASSSNDFLKTKKTPLGAL